MNTEPVLHPVLRGGRMRAAEIVLEEAHALLEPSALAELLLAVRRELRPIRTGTGDRAVPIDDLVSSAARAYLHPLQLILHHDGRGGSGRPLTPHEATLLDMRLDELALRTSLAGADGESGRIVPSSDEHLLGFAS